MGQKRNEIFGVAESVVGYCSAAVDVDSSAKCASVLSTPFSMYTYMA